MSALAPEVPAGPPLSHAAAPRGLSLRWRLILLVVASIVPLLAFSLFLQFWAFRDNVASVGNRALANAHNMSVAVGRELEGCIRGLQVMAAAPELQAETLDISALREHASALAARFAGSSVTLLRKDGRELLNTRTPLGGALPVSADHDTLARVFETGRPAVSPLYKAATDGRLAVAVDVPVKRSDGSVAYVLSMHPGLEIFQHVIQQAQLPASWVASVFDQNTLIVARSLNPEQMVGHPAALSSNDDFKRDREGFLEDGESIEGTRVLRAFSRTPPHDWTVGVGVPRSELTAPALASATTTLVVGATILLISIGLATYAAHRIAKPIETLRRLAEVTDRDALPDPTPTGLREADEVAEVLRRVEEDRRRSRQTERVLCDAVDMMPEGFVIYDDHDRLVLCNQSYRNFYPDNENELLPGATFEEILRVGVGRGRFPDAKGREEEWIAERVRRQHEVHEPIEQALSDGRWALMTKHRLPNGWVVGLRIDITKLKAAEEALKTSEERFRHVFEAVANAIIMVGGDGAIEMVNARAETIFGYPRAELLGKPVEVLLPKRDQAGHRTLRQSFFANPQTRLMGGGRDLNAVRKDGTEFPVEIGLSPIETGDGTKVLASIINISQRRQAQRMQAYYAAIVDSSADAIIAKDLEGRVTSWNKSAELIYGYSASEMIGQPIHRLLPEDRRDEETCIIEQIRQGRRIDHFETVRVHKNGTAFPASLTISPILGPDGEIIGASKIARDITERYRAENQFRRIFDENPIAMALADAETFRFVRVNDAFCRMLGYSAAEIVGHHRDEFTLPEDAGYPRPSEPDAVSEWHPTDRHYRTKSGGIVQARVRLVRLGTLVSGENVVLGIADDVTKYRQVEAQLRQAQKMEAIGNLTGGLAHDFNNLLGIVVGSLDMARRRLADTELANNLIGEALDAAWLGADLTRRLLAFARRQPLHPVQIDVNELVTDTVRLLHRLLGEDIEVSLSLGDHLWSVRVDPAQLESSLANLASNSRDAMPNGGRLIISTANRRLDQDYASTHSDVTPGDFVMIEVSDTGSGMSPEVLEQVFEPFFTTKEPGKGTGLGLSMVFGFLRQSGGHVYVYSEVGKGTTFRLYLPRGAEDASEAVAAEVTPMVGASGETILVVEDNSGMRRVVKRQLVDLGYRVLECERAAAALDIIQHESVDLLFTDIVMPGGLDGVELAKIARERRPDLKVLFTSGFPQDHIDADGGLQLLSKPYSHEELAAALRLALDA